MSKYPHGKSFPAYDLSGGLTTIFSPRLGEFGLMINGKPVWLDENTYRSLFVFIENKP